MTNKSIRHNMWPCLCVCLQKVSLFGELLMGLDGRHLRTAELTDKE